MNETDLTFFQGPKTCDAMALAVPAVVLIVSEAKIFSEPPIFGSLPNADLAKFVEEVSDFRTGPPLSSGSSMTPSGEISS